MQSYRVGKINSRKSSKPVKGWNLRRNEIADSLSVRENLAMVACTECTKGKVLCYYDREQSIKCAECLRHQRDCDGTFSMEEFRKVGEQKKLLQAQCRDKRREMARLRKTLMEARLAMMAAETNLASVESEEVELSDSLASLEDISSRMLRREMLALGALNSLDTEQEVALSEPGHVWEGVPVTDSIDWAAVFESSGGNAAPVQGGLDSVAFHS